MSQTNKVLNIGVFALFSVLYFLVGSFALGLPNAQSRSISPDPYPCAIRFNAVADATISQSQTDFNDNSSSLKIGVFDDDSLSPYSMFLKFDVSGLNYGQLDEAFISVNMISSAGTGLAVPSINITSDQWDQATVTMDNSPQIGTQVGNGLGNGVGNRQYFVINTLDITQDGQYSYYLTSQNGGFEVASSEYGLNLSPQLVIPRDCSSSEYSSQQVSSQSSYTSSTTNSSAGAAQSDTQSVRTEDGNSKKLQALLTIQNPTITVGSNNTINIGRILFSNEQPVVNQTITLNITNPNSKNVILVLTTDSQGAASFVIPGRSQQVSMLDIFRPVSAFAQSFTTGDISDLQVAGNYSAFATLNYQNVEYTTNIITWTVRPLTTVRSGGFSPRLFIPVFTSIIILALFVFAMRMQHEKVGK